MGTLSSTLESESIHCLFMFHSLRQHGLQPTRLLCSWDSPGNNTGVGCHFLLQKGEGIFYSLANFLTSPYLNFLSCKKKLMAIANGAVLWIKEENVTKMLRQCLAHVRVIINIISFHI